MRPACASRFLHRDAADARKAWRDRAGLASIPGSMATSPDHDPIPLLEARGLAFARNDEPVFGPLDFRLFAGEVVLIEGDNGAGKTTLLKVL